MRYCRPAGHFSFGRFLNTLLSAVLCLQLAIPPSALALRVPEVTESAGLEELQRNLDIPTTPSRVPQISAAGSEETAAVAWRVC